MPMIRYEGNEVKAADVFVVSSGALPCFHPCVILMDIRISLHGCSMPSWGEILKQLQDDGIREVCGYCYTFTPRHPDAYQDLVEQ